MQEKIWVPGQVVVANKGLLIDTPGHERLSCVPCPDLTWGRTKDIYSVVGVRKPKAAEHDVAWTSDARKDEGAC